MILIPGAVDGVEVQDIVSENMPKGLTYAHYIHDSELTYEKSAYGVMGLMLTGYDGSCTGGDTHLVIPDEIDGQSVLSLGEELFKGRDAQWILLPYELNDIGQDTFRECSELSHVEMQDNLRIIGWRAFLECESLKDIVLPKELRQIYGYAFSSLKSAELPPRLFYIDPGAFCGFEFISFNISEENDRYTTKNGVLYTEGEEILVSFPAAKEGSYKVPERVREIGERAF